MTVDYGFCNVVVPGQRHLLKGRTIWQDTTLYVVDKNEQVTSFADVEEPVKKAPRMFTSGKYRIRSGCAPCGGCGKVCQMKVEDLIG